MLPVFFQTGSCNRFSAASFITLMRCRFTRPGWSISSLSLCLSAVFGVWHPAYLGWETQEVWGLSRGICVCCSQPLFGHSVPVPPPAAVDRAVPLTLKLFRHTISNSKVHPGLFNPTSVIFRQADMTVVCPRSSFVLLSCIIVNVFVHCNILIWAFYMHCYVFLPRSYNSCI